MNRAFLTLAALAALLGNGPQAKAGLIGSSVNSTYYFPDLNSPYENDGTQVVNPTANFIAFGSVMETVSDTQITITSVLGFDTSFSPGSFNGPVFDVLAGAPTITGVTVDGATNVSGFDASRITLVSDGAGGQLVELNLQSLAFPQNANFTVDLAFGASAIPEPATMTMLGIGLAGLAGYGVRRRKQRAAIA